MECPIFVWNKRNGKIMSKCGEHFINAILQLVFGDALYEQYLNQMSKCQMIILST
jgi:hypothetical protein